MSLKKFFILAVVIATFALVYIQMQVTIYDLAYQGKVKEEKATKLADSNANRALNIARLKSAQSLGDWFFLKNTDADFVTQKHIVQVKASAPTAPQDRLGKASPRGLNPIKLIAQIFSVKSIAEAKPIR